MEDVCIFYCHLVYFKARSRYFVAIWFAYFMVIWYILSRFGMLHQVKSGNLGQKRNAMKVGQSSVVIQ
jgi:hypothetical protein